MKKKAQMQMGESIAIVIVLLILIIFALIFYARIREVNIKEKQVLFEELDIVKLSQIAYNLPEIQCSFAEVTDYGCIDRLKFTFLAEAISTSFDGTDKNTYLYYRALFGISKISLKTIYNNESTQIQDLYSGNRSLDSKNTVFMPVVVQNPIAFVNNFGVLIVEKYT